MTLKRKIFRHVTFGLQIAAIAAFYLPPLFTGGRVGVIWLALGFVHTLAFCAVFFRDSRTRTALSIILTIVTIIWCLALAIILLPIIISFVELGRALGIIVYILSSLFAIIFAIACPRKREGQNPLPNSPMGDPLGDSLGSPLGSPMGTVE